MVVCLSLKKTGCAVSVQTGSHFRKCQQSAVPSHKPEFLVFFILFYFVQLFIVSEKDFT